MELVGVEDPSAMYSDMDPYYEMYDEPNVYRYRHARRQVPNIYDSDIDSDDEDDFDEFDETHTIDMLVNSEMLDADDVGSFSDVVLCKAMLNILKKQDDVEMLSKVVEYVEHKVESEAYHSLMREISCEPTGSEGLFFIIKSFVMKSLLSCHTLPVILETLRSRGQQNLNSDHEKYFPVGPWSHDVECCICLESATCCTRPCCGAVVCDTCLQSHLTARLQEGHLKMNCPAVCDKNLLRHEILHRLSDENKQKYFRFYEAANQNPTRKTCPRCCEVTQVSESSLKAASKKRGLEVECASCYLVWCFSCHAPLHPGVTCQQYREGDILLRQWAKRTHGQYNARHAQKCPKCKFFIERIEGCDHMTCSKCETEFCYACGMLRRKLKLVGHHGCRFSVLGCPKNFLPEKPHLRRFVRGAIFSSAVVGGVSAAAVALPMAVAAATVGLPAFGIYKGVKKLRRMRRERQSLDVREMMEEQLRRCPNLGYQGYRSSSRSRSSGYSDIESNIFGNLFDEEEAVPEEEEVSVETRLFLEVHHDLFEGTELDYTQITWSGKENELRKKIEELLGLENEDDADADDADDDDDGASSSSDEVKETEEDSHSNSTQF